MSWTYIKVLAFMQITLFVLGHDVIGANTLKENVKVTTSDKFPRNLEKRQTPPPSGDLKLDFEVDSDKNSYFAITPSDPSLGYHLSRSTTHNKTRSYSLHWTWPARTTTQAKLTLDFGTSPRTGKEVTQGGIKFWIYHEQTSPSSTMQIVFVGTDNSGAATRSDPTDLKLNFKGWRAVWIGYEEFPPGQYDLKTLSSIEFKITSTSADSFYIDLIQMVVSVSDQTRDAVVSQVGQSTPSPAPSSTSTTSSTTTSSPSSPMPVPFYTPKNFWQQTLRWYEEAVATPPRIITDKSNKLGDIANIEKRLENWYASTTDAISSLGDPSSSTATGYDFKAAKKSRWDTLSIDIKRAHDRYNKIQFSLTRPSLFALKSEFGDKSISTTVSAMTKFGYMFSDVLLPLSLEYSLMSREVEIKYLAKKYCTVLLTSTVTSTLPAVEAIAGQSTYMKRKLRDLVKVAKVKPTNPLNCVVVSGDIPSMEAVIDDFNNQRFQRIKTLLEFLQDQGWAEGSGLGSLDHEMNPAGSGFMHSMFLLRKALRTKEPALLNKLIGAMKWYNDFNEIYQNENDYVYNGTTADRMRTIALFRLMIILIDNVNQDQQITDMSHYNTWMKHALRINKGLGGLIKPDFTGFHHKTFYGSAYVPHALHNAALVQYLLDGTLFELAQESKDNIRKALETMRIVAVKYSPPNSINGRFPGYSRAVLVKHVPAYAYSSYVHGNSATPAKVDKPEMFLRLFDTALSDIDSYLNDGKISSPIFYWNTIGSIDVLKKASTLSCTSSPPCTAESSPTGHWCKNFAALSIHRRGDWSVAAKGMNRYTWDYESSGSENVFGVFASHGSLQISNSEGSLEVYDVNNGWDWSRVPGATTIQMVIDQVKTSRARNYNYAGKFAGGVAFIGSTGGKPQNGAFGMHFIKPDYLMKGTLTGTPLDNAIFEFKKSYFFYDHLIVCLGSDIKLGGVAVATNFAQTTLFQDKLLDPVTSRIKISKTSYNFNGNPTFKKEFSTSVRKRIQDTHGNLYQVDTGDNILTVEINTQTSKKSNGRVTTSGDYAVAYLRHKMASSSSMPTEIYSYKYAILLAGGSKSLLRTYSVLKQDSKVHAIKLSSIRGLSSGTEIYGYSVFSDFSSSPLANGPVNSVNASCMIMIEKVGTTLYLAISDPTIKFGDDSIMVGKETCREKKPKVNPYSPKNSNDVGNKLLFCVEGKPSDAIKVTLNVGVASIASVKVDGKVSSQNPTLVTTTPSHPQLIFPRLVNGRTTAVKLNLT